MQELSVRLTETERSLAHSETDIVHLQRSLSEIKALAEETSQLVAEGLTEFRQIVSYHGKNLEQLDKVTRTGNGESLLVRVAIVERELETAKEAASKNREEAVTLMEKTAAEKTDAAASERKEKRSARVTLIIAVLSLLGTLATALISRLGP